MNYKFIQPVSMRVTEEQYQRDLREPLLKMGYEEVRITDWDEAPILATNYEYTEYILSNVGEESKDNHDRYFIPDYNPEFFLAIAAMSNIKYGIYGEWWYCTENVKMLSNGRIEYNKGKLYMGLDNERIINNSRGNNHYWRDDNRFKHFRKATLQELIEKFTNQKQDIMKEITNEQFNELKNLIAPENVEKFNKLMGIKKPIPKKEELITGDKVVFRNGDVYLVIKDCNAGDNGRQIFALLECKISGNFTISNEYDERLYRKRGFNKFDIMKIYRYAEGRINCCSMSTEIDEYTLIWER